MTSGCRMAGRGTRRSAITRAEEIGSEADEERRQHLQHGGQM